MKILNLCFLLLGIFLVAGKLYSAEGTKTFVLDFDKNGVVDYSDYMYFYNYAGAACPTKSDDWFIADSLSHRY